MGDTAALTPDERWLAETLPFVRAHLPSPPASVLELGCGSLGGFVPALRAEGYDAVGIDPKAPEEPHYHRVEFERYEVTRPVDAIVACASLHHVADPHDVLGQMAAALAPGAVLVVVEWAHERFDEATARWCFARLPATEGEPGWLHRARDEWSASGMPWDSHFRAWAEEEGLHTSEEVLRALAARFDGELVAEGPHFYPDLGDTTAADEQAAIDAGQIQATGIRYVGRLRPSAG